MPPRESSFSPLGPGQFDDDDDDGALREAVRAATRAEGDAPFWETQWAFSTPELEALRVRGRQLYAELNLLMEEMARTTEQVELLTARAQAQKTEAGTATSRAEYQRLAAVYEATQKEREEAKLRLGWLERQSADRSKEESGLVIEVGDRLLAVRETAMRAEVEQTERDGGQEKRSRASTTESQAQALRRPSPKRTRGSVPPRSTPAPPPSAAPTTRPAEVCERCVKAGTPCVWLRGVACDRCRGLKQKCALPGGEYMFVLVVSIC